MFLHNLKILLEQTKTMFNGEITKQKIIDIPCEIVKPKTEPSEQTEVLKEPELNENKDDSANEEAMEQSSQTTET